MNQNIGILNKQKYFSDDEKQKFMHEHEKDK
ncbi:hypothetical protein SLY_0847 [Strawberry lethal yellows phytoplasma (CPA) str. NZSb11]|uniref:Uncharacterized protein n=1 Tax=Strawberry lethal yellows phytoplasma (CPA) str. NZSb11 TaxID=980422 RepID=R4S1T7_PHYAS|nr:hypothetical protein SLY_0847 [Strawberry lethal yellows phytoplasma (CPA) str. NZSb11]